MNSTNQTQRCVIKLQDFLADKSRTTNKSEVINYAVSSSPFGQFFVAATETGVCQLDFLDSDDITQSISKLSQTWPMAEMVRQPSQPMALVEEIFKGQQPSTGQIPLHLRGTEFQIDIWQALLNIPIGHLSTYAEVAHTIGHPKALRAVGTAIGANPVAFLVPCHRVIRKDGAIGGYRWGITRKSAIINWEKPQKA